MTTTQQSIWTQRFWKDTAERTIRTTAQVAAASFGAPAFMTAVTEGDWANVPWQAALLVTTISAVLTVLTALAGKTVGDPSTASLTAGTQPALVKGQ